jgi:hypothetical protein
VAFRMRSLAFPLMLLLIPCSKRLLSLFFLAASFVVSLQIE